VVLIKNEPDRSVWPRMKRSNDSKRGDDRIRHSRALVLGGGGPVGRAWEIGLVEGFTGQEIDLGSADLIVGTSAGAMVGAWLALKQRLGAPHKIEASASAAVSSGGMAVLIAAMVRATLSPAPELVRMEIGKMALDAQTVSEEVSLSRPMFAPLVGQAWPNRFRATAVNVRTGQFQVWDSSLGAPWERAVAASMAVPGMWPPITINGEKYMDGGIRSMLNTDLAIGFDVVIAVSCFALTPPGHTPCLAFPALRRRGQCGHQPTWRIRSRMSPL
jgi:NTE family protein